MFSLATPDLLWSVLLVAAAVLLVASLVSISRNAALSADARAPWILVAVLLPVVGPIAWFMARPRKRRRVEDAG